LCVAFCPKEMLVLSERVNERGLRVAEVREDVECSGCLNCVTMCPECAIEIEDGEPADRGRAARASVQAQRS